MTLPAHLLDEADKQMLKEYDIQFEKIYNMDEKCLLIGKLQKTQRVFTKDLYKLRQARRSWSR
jgi:hypothetical protein